MYKLSPSILAADFSKLGEEIKAVADAGAEYIHIDVMDGVFVPSISLGMPVIQSVRKITDKIFDVHLMITEPERYIKDFVKCGADIITVHFETLKYPGKVIEDIKAMGVKVGLSINPETSVQAVLPYLRQLDMVLIMTVRPGFGGQEYIGYCTEKVSTLRKHITEHGFNTDIEVDGGINTTTIETVLEAGANVIVMGSSIFKGNISENMKKYTEILNKWESAKADKEAL